MSEAKKQLTIDDPVSPEVLGKFQTLTNSRLHMGDKLLDLENEKVRLMVAVRQIDTEKQRLFEKELLDRGLAPDSPIEIDGETGKITMTPTADPNEDT